MAETVSQNQTKDFKMFERLSILLCVGFFSCVSASRNSSALVPASANSDESYFKAYEAAHVELLVNNEFQKKFDAHGVLFSTEMRRAYTERWTRLHGKTDAGLGDLSGGKLAVILSYFSPEDDYMDLTNAQLWSVSLNVAGTEYPPTLVQRLQQKTALKVFFPFINHWSADYLLVFDANSDTKGESQSVTPTPSVLRTQLSLSSALVQAKLVW